MNPLDQRWQAVRDRWPIRVKNGSGETIPPFSVLRITGIAFTNNERVYSVAKPDGTYRWRYLVSGPFAIGSSSTNEGLGTFLTQGGLVYCSGTPALDEEWGPTASQWYLSQYRPGFIVSGSSTSFNGATLLDAIQAIPAEVRVQNDTGGDVAANSSATYSLFGGSAGTTDLGLDITATNGTSISFKNTKYGSVGRVSGKNWVVPWQT